MSKTKVIAWYLPQYHSIPENDEFWGKDFTDWVTVKKAKPLFDGHDQPKTPLNNYYYDLSEKETIVWQAKLANDYGIFGWGIYHYWFNNEKNILTKPSEIIKNNPDININYFFAWDNANWKRSWSNVFGNAWAPTQEDSTNVSNQPEILIPYIIGEKPDWQNHYNYVRDFFFDKRYIKVNNKPVFVILQYSADIAKMCTYWDLLAREDGFDGMYFIFKDSILTNGIKDIRTFFYEPVHHGWSTNNIMYRLSNKAYKLTRSQSQCPEYNYDLLWKRILRESKTSSQCTYLGGFVSYDDTPRRGKKGIIVSGGSPEKFKKYFQQLLSISEKQNKEFVFLTAWNEWGEGAYLEPDVTSGFSYLKALKDLL